MVTNDTETPSEEESHERVQPIRAQLVLKALEKLHALMDEVGRRRRREELQTLRAEVDLVNMFEVHPGPPKQRSANWNSCGRHIVAVTGSRSGIIRDAGRKLARVIRSRKDGLKTELQVVEASHMSLKGVIGEPQEASSGPTGAN
jgi:hypothetical protein